MSEFSDRRRTGRVNQVGLDSNLGPVLDISAGGLRILSTRRLSGEKNLVLRGQDQTVNVRAVVVWRKRLGFMRHDIGMAFVEPDTEMVKTLTRLAATHRADVSLAA